MSDFKFVGLGVAGLFIFLLIVMMWTDSIKTRHYEACLEHSRLIRQTDPTYRYNCCEIVSDCLKETK